MKNTQFVREEMLDSPAPPFVVRRVKMVALKPMCFAGQPLLPGGNFLCDTRTFTDLQSSESCRLADGEKLATRYIRVHSCK